MGKQISLFSGYSQKENRNTNYCLLILKQLYDEDETLFANTISRMIGIDISNYVGVKFKQQEKRASSTPDD